MKVIRKNICIGMLLLCTMANAQPPAAYTGGLTQQNAVDSFPYRIYLQQHKRLHTNEIMALRRHLDSLELNGQRIVFNLCTNHLLASENPTQADFTTGYLLDKINKGQMFMAYAAIDEYNAVLFNGIGSFWLEHANHIVDDTVAAVPSLAYRKDYAYVIQRLCEAKFAPTLPAESNSEKLISTISEKEWGHLAERFNERAPLSIKLVTLLMLVLMVTGALTAFRFAFNYLKK